MAFNKETYELNEGFVERGVISAPQNIGTVGNGDPLTSFTLVQEIGFIERGSMAININREYATSESGTPAATIRKDLIRKAGNISFSSLQISDPDLWEKRDGLFVLKGYNDSGFLGDLGFGGPDEPVQPEEAWLLKTQTVDGTPYNYMIYAGRITTEDISETRSGDAHVAVGMQIEMFAHPNFNISIPTEAQKAYFLKWTDNS